MRHIVTESLLLCLLSVVLSSCTTVAKQAPARITLGTFNMEWFGDNSSDDHKPRTVADDALLAEILRDTDADVLAVQEIENPEALKRLLRLLPEYRFVLGSTGGKQHVGFLYRPPVEIDSAQELTAIAVEEGRTRAGLLVQCKVGAIHWLMLAVHLKSMSRADSTPALEERSRTIRRLQAAQIRGWADSVLEKTKEQNVIILGDWNDSPRKKRNALDTLKSAARLTFLTSERMSCAYSGLPAIDHIVMSDSALLHVLPGTLRTVNFRAMLPDKEAQRVSDHCPIIVQISP
jgi:endonuclease/exonuclease/phosphatase family metal-dependent hydrolase